MRQPRVLPMVSVLACSALLAAAAPAAAQVRFKSGVADLPVLNDVGARLGAVQAVAAKLALAGGAVAGVVSLAVAVLVGDMGGSLAVTLNALRLARTRDGSSSRS